MRAGIKPRVCLARRALSGRIQIFLPLASEKSVFTLKDELGRTVRELGEREKQSNGHLLRYRDYIFSSDNIEPPFKYRAEYIPSGDFAGKPIVKQFELKD